MTENRAPFQVLMFPYRLTRGGTLRYAVFRRADLGVWQGLSGGGQYGETPEQAARREAAEEAQIPATAPLLRLEATGAISAEHFSARKAWGPDVKTIPEYSFGIAVVDDRLPLSAEHTASDWLDIRAALARLEWASNRVALAELHRRLTGEDLAVTL